MNPEILLFTVVYPQALPYFKDICSSISSQIYCDFECLVINDGCEKQCLEENLSTINHKIVDALGSPANNRQQGINYAIDNGFRYLFLCDADDTFENDRLKRTIEEFENNNADIIVSNLNVVDETLHPIINNYFSIELPTDRWIDSTFIMDKNIFGMSNTAIRIASIKNHVKIPEIPIVDWYLFTIMLNDGLRAKYISDALVNYRQHEANLIGINNFSIESFKKLSKLKHNHYRQLVGNGFGQYKQLLDDMEKLISLKDEEIEYIINAQLTCHKQPLWWQIITGNNNIKIY